MLNGLTQIATLFGVGLSGFDGVGIVKTPYIPAFWWHFNDPVAPLAQHLPKSLGIFCISGKTAA